jgi:RNA-binding protein YhbY
MALEIQLGKNGLTPEFLKDIELRLDKYRNATLRIRVLNSARESKQDVKKYADEIIAKLGDKYTYKTMGFRIMLRKWRKARTPPCVSHRHMS